MRVVVGGVGYRNLRDHSLGIAMSDELEPLARPPALVVEDLSYNPVAVAQWLAEEMKADPIARVIFVSAIERKDGRTAGTVRAYRWDRTLPSEEEIQGAVTDAVTGVILVDNTLVVCQWMNALPPEVVVVEVQPLEHEFGDEMSADVARAYVEAKNLVMRLATDEAATAALPLAPLGGAPPSETDVLAEVEQLIAELTAHPDPAVGTTTTALLERIDAVHRIALSHLMGAIQSMAGDAFVNRLTADPAIRLLLMSYDLLTVDRRTLAEEALDGVRGHLHSHGIDVELMEVRGGVVSVRLHGAPPPGEPAFDGVRQDIAETLRAGFLGFQELEIVDGTSRRAPAKDSTFLPQAALQRAKRPVYRPVFPSDTLASGQMKSAVVDSTNVLIARVGEELFAVRNACGESPLPFDYSTLTGTELKCSWHGCRYDIRTGHRLDRPDAAREELLNILPVRVREGMIEIVVGTAALKAHQQADQRADLTATP